MILILCHVLTLCVCMSYYHFVCFIGVFKIKNLEGFYVVKREIAALITINVDINSNMRIFYFYAIFFFLKEKGYIWTKSLTCYTESWFYRCLQYRILQNVIKQELYDTKKVTINVSWGVVLFLCLLIIHVHTKHCNKRFVQWSGTLNKHLKGSLNAVALFK